MAKKRTLKMSKFGRLLLTRQRGRQIADEFPDDCVDLVLDFEGVEAASPSFLDETLRGAFTKGIHEVHVINTTETTKRNLDKLMTAEATISRKAGLRDEKDPTQGPDAVIAL